MKGKRMLALLLAALLCPMLTACAKDVNLDGMSEEELLALKEAVEQRLPKSMDLDAMDFDELIALRDAVEERLDPSVDEVILPEGAVLLESCSDVNLPYYVVGENITPGTWRMEAKPYSYAIVEIYDDEKFSGFLLDKRPRPLETERDVPDSCQYYIRYGGESIVISLENGDHIRVGSNGIIVTPMVP